MHLRTYFIICVFVLGLLPFSECTLTAQDNYVHSIGLRGGPLAGIAYKRFLEFPAAIEGIAGINFTNGRLATLTGLYEQQFFIDYGLNWYAGGGLTLAFNKNDFRLIVEGILGIEYTFDKVPLALSLDYKPAYHIFGNTFYFNEFAMTVRYVIAR